MAVENGFEAMLLTGHIGKLIKVAGRHHEHTLAGRRLPDGTDHVICSVRRVPMQIRHVRSFPA